MRWYIVCLLIAVSILAIAEAQRMGAGRRRGGGRLGGGGRGSGERGGKDKKGGGGRRHGNRHGGRNAGKGKRERINAAGEAERIADQMCPNNKNVGDEWVDNGFMYRCIAGERVVSKRQSRRKSRSQRGRNNEIEREPDFIVKRIGCALPDGTALPVDEEKRDGDILYKCKRRRRRNDREGAGDISLVIIEGNEERRRCGRQPDEEQPSVDCALARCIVKEPTEAPYCKSSGDPHTYTYDNYKHHYQGTCRQIIAKPKHGYPHNFEVIQKNEHREGSERINGATGQRVSFVKYIEVLAHGHKFRLMKGGVLEVDGVIRSLPYVFPERSADACEVEQDCLVNVQKRGDIGTLLNTDFGLAAYFDGKQLMQISIPNDGELVGNMVGMCGNNDGNQENDCRFPNGTISDDWVACGNSWVVHGDEDDEGCELDAPLPDCNDDQTALHEEKCGILKDYSEDATFSDCFANEELRATAAAMYDDCMFDMCQFQDNEQVYCNAISAFAKLCQNALADFNDDGEEIGVTIDWRQPGLCEEECGANQQFSPNGAACAATCSNPSPNCQQTGVETCECIEGMVLEKEGGECIPVTECGCIDEDNDYRTKGESWVNQDCDSTCTCTEQGVECTTMQCDPGMICGARDGQRACLPGPETTAGPPEATEAPATEAPATEAPATEAPATEAPATEAPATEAPATEAPATEVPATEAPATEAPATEVPATEAPATEAPATEAPTTERPPSCANGGNCGGLERCVDNPSSPRGFNCYCRRGFYRDMDSQQCKGIICPCA